MTELQPFVIRAGNISAPIFLYIRPWILFCSIVLLFYSLLYMLLYLLLYCYASILLDVYE